MALRSTMTALISRLRRLIGDPAGSDQVWPDEDLQDALDAHRREARYARLREIETITAGGAVEYKIFAADVTDWEDAALVDSSFAAITPNTSDLLTGRWEFTTAPNRPVMISGFYYDIYGAAVEVLESWLGLLKSSNAGVDFTADGLTVKRSQKVEQLQTLLKRCEARQWVDTGCVIQTDFEPTARHYGAW